MYKLLKKNILIITLTCFFNVLNSQTIKKDDDIIYWTKDYRLTFADFKGDPNKEDTTSYHGNSNKSIHNLGIINKSIDIQFQTKAGIATFEIYAGMNKRLSWIKNSNDTITLKHEQGHFDICEIYSRVLRREIKKAASLTEAKNIFDKISDEENLEQDRYDKENTFELGGITSYWSNTIIKRLNELDSYQYPVVKLAIRE